MTSEPIVPSTMSDPEEFLESVSRPTGARLGVRYGVSFEVIYT
jgi:hypothetical protein